ncbi:signal peptidase I [Acaryochloris marina NIES-2412]|uniref:signal peptidase I n=1 Tax=Acaryochloris marina TaxID=155978 RepID=UPI0040580E86
MLDTEPENISKPSSKEPWLAVNWSMILPGLGHLYAGKPLQGWGIILAYLALFLLSLFSVITAQETGLIGFGAIVLFLLLGFGSWISAYRAAIRTNDTAFENHRKTLKDPWLAVFLSRFILGAGHLYMGKWILGSILIVAEILTWIYAPGLVFLGLWFVLPFVANHAYQAASDQRKNSKNIILKLFLLLVIAPIGLSITFGLAIRSLIVEARYIPSGGMEPTLKINDRIVVDKVSYLFRTPKRGDIILFKPTQALKRAGFENAFLKRIIGLPGDEVEIKQNVIWINNQPLQEPYTMSGTTESPSPDICRSNYVTMDVESKPIDPPIPIYLSQPQTIPPDHYLVLGDHRELSLDSRCWGLVKRSEIIGQATKRFFPFNRMGRLDKK